MPTTNSRADTPQYVLMSDKRRIGPTVIQLESDAACSAIYGFSNKGPYDKFVASSTLALTPYPLVRGYLRGESDSRGEELKLVVVDATGPDQPRLLAATIETVLESQESKTTQVVVTHQLAFDAAANGYRVSEVVE